MAKIKFKRTLVSRQVPCPFKCKKPTPATLFVRHHPLRNDAEIRECPECRRQSIWPTGEGFKEDWGLRAEHYAGPNIFEGTR